MYIAPKNSRYLERTILLIAGVLSLVGVGLGYFVSVRFLIINLVIGLNLAIFALTGFCLLANILIKCGLESNLK